MTYDKLAVFHATIQWRLHLSASSTLSDRCFEAPKRPYTLISNAIFSPKWRKNQRCFGINFFGLITCYRPGSNQIRRNLLLKTYLNNFPWCVNLVEFHFLLKFLNSYVITPSENQKVLFTLAEIGGQTFFPCFPMMISNLKTIASTWGNVGKKV